MDIAALILSTIALGLALFSTIEVMAQRRSTHQIQMVPIDDLNKEAEKLKDLFSSEDPQDLLDV